MKKYLILIMAMTFILNFNLFCVKIYVANLNVYKADVNVELSKNEKNATNALFKAIKKTDEEGLLNLFSVSQSVTYSDKVTKSTIEAAELCELLHIDYLLYGFIEKTSKYFNAEVRLYEKDTKMDKKIFYVKTDAGNIDDVISELSDKIKNYLYSMFGVSEYFKERKTGFGGIGIYNSVGYWFPVGEWWKDITGLVTFETGLNVVPVTPMAKARNFAYYMRFGFYTSYSLAINKPGFLDSYYNSIIFRIPVENCLEIFFNHVFIIGAGPQLQLDVLYQKKLFDAPYTGATVAFSIYTNIGYEYWFGKNKVAGMGLNNIVDFTFYNPFYVDYKIELYSAVRFSLDKKAKNKTESKFKKEEKIKIENKNVDLEENKTEDKKTDSRNDVIKNNQDEIDKNPTN